MFNFISFYLVYDVNSYNLSNQFIVKVDVDFHLNPHLIPIQANY